MIADELNTLAGHDDEVDMTNLSDPLLALSAMLMLLLAPFSVVATNLANVPGQPAADQQQPPVAISFNADGELFWNREPIGREELSHRLANLRKPVRFRAFTWLGTGMQSTKSASRSRPPWQTWGSMSKSWCNLHRSKTMPPRIYLIISVMSHGAVVALWSLGPTLADSGAAGQEESQGILTDADRSISAEEGIWRTCRAT